MDLPRLREGNVALQVFSATTRSPAGQNYESNTADSDTITWLAHEMLQAGFTETEIRLVMGENVRRFLLENLPET